MHVKKNTIKKMVRKQMIRNYLRRDQLPNRTSTHGWFASLQRCRYALKHPEQLSRLGFSPRLGEITYPLTRDLLFSAEPGFLRLSKVEYDAKFTAVICARMPELLRATAEQLAARILDQLPDGYWDVGRQIKQSDST